MPQALRRVGGNGGDGLRSSFCNLGLRKRRENSVRAQLNYAFQMKRQSGLDLTNSSCAPCSTFGRTRTHTAIAEGVKRSLSIKPVAATNIIEDYFVAGGTFVGLYAGG